MNDQRNLILAIALSMAILIGFNYFYETPKHAERLKQSEITSTAANNSSSSAASSSVPSTVASQSELQQNVIVDRSQALEASHRISIKAQKVTGSINLQGGRIDDISLVGYHETVDPTSPEIVLLSPDRSQNAYYADFGWISADSSVSLPTATTVWQASSSSLTPNTPVTLSWKNDQDILFERTISVDDQYMFSVTDRVTNNGSRPLSLNGFSQVTRLDTPKTGGFMILHEGPIGVLNGKLHELDYAKLKEKKVESEEITKGWLGITDKYWLVALIPSQSIKHHTRFKAATIQGRDAYQVEVVGETQTLEVGKTAEFKQHLFSGAKQLRMLDAYEANIGFDKFDLAIDFGWFYFLTKPLFYIMEYLNKVLGNFGIAILVLTVLIKIAFFPLANKSYRSMSRMKQVQPKIEALKARYGDDKIRMNQELMELYKKEKINPMSGCLPMLIQAPVFFCLYKVLFVTLEMRHAPFYGWIHDLSAPDPTSIFNLFGLLPFSPPSFLMIGLWPLLMGLTMLVQQKMNPQPADPIQAKMFLIMPVFLTVLLASFPAGLVIYWAWNNVLSMLQQWMIMRLEK